MSVAAISSVTVSFGIPLASRDRWVFFGFPLATVPFDPNINSIVSAFQRVSPDFVFPSRKSNGGRYNAYKKDDAASAEGPTVCGIPTHQILKPLVNRQCTNV